MPHSASPAARMATQPPGWARAVATIRKIVRAVLAPRALRRIRRWAVWGGVVLLLVAGGLFLVQTPPLVSVARGALALAGACVVIGALTLLGARATRNVTSLRAMIRLEVSRLAQERKHLAEPWWRPIWRSTLVLTSTPSWRSTLMAVLLGTAIWALVFMASGSASLDGHEDRLLTLWQVQAAFAGFALPFLLYIIEHTSQQAGLARKTSEVLIRQTLIFPVLCLVITLTLLPAIALQWFPQNYAHLAGTLGLITTVIVVLFAYQRAIRLLSDPRALREHSIQLLEERLEESMDQEVDRRLGARILLTELTKLGVAFSHFPPSRHNTRFLVLNASTTGALVDVDIWELERFVEALPPIRLTLPENIADRTEPEEADVVPQAPPAIAVLKQYRQPIPARDRGLVALRRDAFGSLNQRLLEEWLSAVFRVASQ